MSEQGPGELSVPRIWQILIIDTTQKEKTPLSSNGPPPFPVVGDTSETSVSNTHEI